MTLAHDGAHTLQRCAGTREIASALRDLSRAARRHSEVIRAHNAQTRARASEVHEAVRETLTALRPRDVPPPSVDATIRTHELVQILVDHHHWPALQAWVVLSVEMELLHIPEDARDLDSTQALDLLERLLARGPA